MKTILIALALCACAADSEPQFDVVDCLDGSGNVTEGKCQRACNSQAAMELSTGPQCIAFAVRDGDADDGPHACTSTFEWNGVTGCCSYFNEDPTLYFLECQDEN